MRPQHVTIRYSGQSSGFIFQAAMLAQQGFPLIVQTLAFPLILIDIRHRAAASLFAIWPGEAARPGAEEDPAGSGSQGADKRMLRQVMGRSKRHRESRRRFSIQKKRDDRVDAGGGFGGGRRPQLHPTLQPEARFRADPESRGLVEHASCREKDAGNHRPRTLRLVKTRRSPRSGTKNTLPHLGHGFLLLRAPLRR